MTHINTHTKYRHTAMLDIEHTTHDSKFHLSSSPLFIINSKVRAKLWMGRWDRNIIFMATHPSNW